MIDLFERNAEKIPRINGYYQRRAGRIKRACCLLLHRLGLLRPLSFVEWLATYGCNFRCPYCEASAARPAANELTTAEVKALLDDLREMGVKRFLISGGEPLTRRDVIEIMRYADGKGLELGLVTNGYLVEEMWDNLRPFKYFLYFTSIDGIPDYNDRMRGKEKAFLKALKGLELFAQTGVPIRIVNTLVHPGNIGQLESLLPLLKDSGANHWRLSPVSKIGRAANESKYSLSGQQLRYLARFIGGNRDSMRIDFAESHAYLGLLVGDLAGKPFFCGAGLTRCSIMPDGEVLGCQQVYDSALSEGNLRDRLFSQIWREGFARFRRRECHAFCSDCTVLDACQGGCWAEMEKQKACLKPVWESSECL